MRFITVSAIFLSLSLGTGAAATAQTPPDTQAVDTAGRTPVYRLGELRVTVTRSSTPIQRSPLSVSVLGVNQLQLAQPGVSLDEALRFIPGVFAQNRRNFALGDRLTIRGVGARAQFGVRGIQILVDGVPLTMPDGQAALTNLDLSSAGEVEVIRGPASSLYGNAAGGVLIYHTEAPWSGPLRTLPDALFGSYGLQKLQMGASGQAGRLGYRLNANRLETDGFREHNHAEMYRANLLTRTTLSDATELRGVFNFFRMPFGENPSSLDRETALNDPRSVRGVALSQGLGEEDTQGQGGLMLYHSWGRGQELRATGWGLFRNIWNPIPSRIIDLHRKAAGFRSEYRGSAEAGELPIRWTLGMDLGLQNDDRQEFGNAGVPASGGRTAEGPLALDQTERVVNFGPFLQLEARPVRRIWLTLGGRLDSYDFHADDHFLSDGNDSGGRTMTHFSPMVGLSYAPLGALHVYANYATAFETPTTSELSNRPSGQGGFNPQLGPVDTRSFEMGFKGFSRRAGLVYGVTGYVARVDGALIPFEGPTEEVFYRNAGKIDRQGVELQLGWLPAPGFRADMAYTYQRSKFDRFVTPGGDYSGNLEPGVPQHQIFLGGTYTAPFGLRSEVNLRWVDAYPVDDANTASNWSYRVVDLRFSLDRGFGDWRVQPFLGLDSLFDERYNGSVVPNAFGGNYYEPAPGRAVYGGLTVPVDVR